MTYQIIMRIEAVSNAVYIISRFYKEFIITPYEVHLNVEPNNSHMHPFDTKIHVHILKADI